MTYSPQTWKDVRAVFQKETGMPPVSLGIQHYSVQGGGYHEGNDLLAEGGRLNTDYSKRETDRDRPGTDGANAIDIGWFDVNVLHSNGSVRRVTLITMNEWLLRNVNAADALWIREFIYTVDRTNVKRWDRLGVRTTGDSSHLTHTHVSGFRDNETTPKAGLFERFWSEMRGGGSVGFIDDTNAAALAFRVDALASGASNVRGGPTTGENMWTVQAIKGIGTKVDALIAEAAADKARDALTLAAVQALQSGGSNVDTAAIINAVNAATTDVKDAVLAELAEERERAAEAARAEAESFEKDE